MKKKIALVTIGFLMIVYLTACGIVTSVECDKLRQEVSSLKSQLESLKFNHDSSEYSLKKRISELEEFKDMEERTIHIKELPSYTSKVEDSSLNASDVEESSTNTEELEENNSSSKQQMIEYLDNQANTKSPLEWLSVASCPLANEENLLKVAEKCASINASSEYDYIYTSNIESYATAIASVLCVNPNSTNHVLEKLTESEFPSVWLIIANSEIAGESTLKSIAQKCATMSYYLYTSDNQSYALELANTLAANPNCTCSVMQELVNSKFSDIVLIGHRWIEKQP